MKLEQIDTSTTAGKAEVMRLAAQGRRVALRGRFSEVPWGEMEPDDTPLWNWVGTDYAIISEPVGPGEVWCVINDDGTASSMDTEAQARHYVDYGLKSPDRVVRYIRADVVGEVP